MAIETLRVDLAARGTKALLVIRHDAIVCEWYAPDHGVDKSHYTASLAKAIVGGLSLAVALNDGRLALDDPASKFVPQWRDDPRKSSITLRQLGSHTSGIEDAEARGKAHDELTGWKGDFWKRLPVPNDPFTLARDHAPLVFEPGQRMQYSNPGIALMTWCATAALRDTPHQDIRSLLRERIMRPIGVSDAEWSVGYGQTFTVDGLPLVASWGGGGYTARAAARVGRLMLRGGEWEGRRILSAEAVRLTTSDAGTPGPCGIGWWSNQEGDCAALPRDAFFGSGAGHQILLVVPSLDLVLVRFGGVLASVVADPRSYHEAYCRHLFEPLMAAMSATPLEAPPPPARETRAAPYPPSPVLAGLEWAPREAIVRRASGSDNWPLTWADDDDLYTAYGDGRGFEPFTPEKLSLGFARISGGPADYAGINLRSPTGEARGGGPQGRKASGLLSVDGTLWLLARNAGNAQLAWSTDHGATWTWADWTFTTSFGCPTFLNFGRDYAGARDGFVYLYSPDSNSAYEPADRMVLARVPKERLRERDAYEFLVGLDTADQPVWSKDLARRGAVFINPGRCYRSGITFNTALRRYLWVQILPQSRHPQGPRFQGGFGVYDAPEPWGPWSTVFFTEDWDVGPGETASFPTKWIDADGLTMHLVFSGDDGFAVRKATLLPHPGPFTRVALRDGRWTLNGRPTNPGSAAEGLLMNVRMVNAVFEDRNRPEFDPEANTDRFIARLPEYLASGVNAFTLCLQGGMPGYEGAVNSAFDPDGTLRPAYLSRVERVIRACDRQGLAVLLGLFYQRQSAILRDEDAVRAGVVNAARWVRDRGFQNVLLEIANEYPHGGFAHALIRDPQGQAGLIRLAQATAPGLLVSASGYGDGAIDREVAEAADFLLPHWNGTKVDQIAARITTLKRFGKAVVCNEDDKTGSEAVAALRACVENGASYGLMLKERNQTFPFRFDGPADDPVFYAELRARTTPRAPGAEPAPKTTPADALKRRAAEVPPPAPGSQPIPAWFAKAPPFPPPGGKLIRVATVDELFVAVDRVESGDTILLTDGHYRLLRVLVLDGKRNIALRSAAGDPARVTLSGRGWDSDANGDDLVHIAHCDGVTIADLTFEDCRFYGIKVEAENAPKDVHIYHCRFRNIGVRAIKGSAGQDPNVRAVTGSVRHCHFENTKVPPADWLFGGDYIAAIDMMALDDWTFSDNVFRNIKGRTGGGRAAIFVWVRSRRVVVERNLILDCDRGVAFGNPGQSTANLAGEPLVYVADGIIRNNVIVGGPDCGIELWYAEGIKVLHNTIWRPEQNRSRGIRVGTGTSHTELVNNLVHGGIRFDGGEAEMSHNLTGRLDGYFADPALADLSLTRKATGAIDQGTPHPDAGEDIRGRPRVGRPDLGAWEFPEDL